jgi:long-chain fatty acid transport protein
MRLGFPCFPFEFVRCVALAAVVSGPVILGLPREAGAQAVPTFGGLSFSFETPGARSSSMGGAFVGLADDATAAVTNPAGLSQIVKPEFFIAGRGSSFETHWVGGGLLTGRESGEIVSDGFVRGRSTNSRFSMPVATLVLPKGRFTFAAFAAEAAEFKASYTVGITSIRIVRTTSGASGLDSPPVEGTEKYTVSSYGGAVAYAVSEQLSLGANVALQRLRQSGNSISHDYSVDGSGRVAVILSPVAIATASDNTDFALNYSLAAHWRPSRLLMAGAAWRPGATFEMSEHSDFNLSGNVFQFDSDYDFRVPDVFSVGVASRPMDSLAVSGEVDWVRYSTLRYGPYRSVPYRRVVTHASGAGERDEAAQFGSPSDGAELRLGVEYTLLSWPSPVALRAGFLTEPPHSFPAVPCPLCDSVFQRADELLYPSGERVSHWSFGGGIVAGDWRADVGASLSSVRDVVTVSLVRRF